MAVMKRFDAPVDPGAGFVEAPPGDSQLVNIDGSQTLANKTFNGQVNTGPITGPAPVVASAATLAVTAALHAGKTVLLDRAAGVAVTLPAATGTGNKYRFVVKTTFTGAATIKVANATDIMKGVATLFQDGGDAVVGFATAADTDTITFAADNSTGGIAGAVVEIEDIATGQFHVRIVSDAAATEATPFSATVS